MPPTAVLSRLLLAALCSLAPVTLIAVSGSSVPAASAPATPEPGFVNLFNGRDLTGWKGDTRIWSVRDGAIVGESKPDTGLAENSYLIWQDGTLADFELRAQFKIESGNSGIYCRARIRPPGQTTPDPLIGWQADIDTKNWWTGVIMEWTGREKLAERGQRVHLRSDGTREVVGSLGNSDALATHIRPVGEWNDYTIRAVGGEISLTVNGVRMTELLDEDERRVLTGLLALQLHVGPPMRVQFKNLRLLIL